MTGVIILAVSIVATWTSIIFTYARQRGFTAGIAYSVYHFREAITVELGAEAEKRVQKRLIAELSK